MNLDPSNLFKLAVSFGFLNLTLSLVLAFARLAKGPSLPDRVVALDLIAIIAAGFITLYAISSGQPVYLDVAITLTLIAFLSTVAFARYLQQTGARDRRRGAPR